jgi:hypothetical protein
MSAVATNITNRAILAEAIATGGTLKDATLHLFSNDFVPTPLSVKADFVESAFDGYAAPGTIAWGTPYTAPDGSEHVTAPTAQVTCTGSTTPETVYGYYVLSVATGTPLLMAERFANPVPIAQAGDAVFATADYVLGG